VCVPGGSTNLENLQLYNDGNLIDPAGREVVGDPVEIVEVPDQTDCLVLFQQSAVDAITADDTVLFGFAAQDPYAEVVGDAISTEPYGVGASLDHPELTEFVNLVLEQLRTNGRWTEIYEEWVLPYVDAPVPEPPPATYGRVPPQ
jgi:polar amino acid transport system substrate-binding protein